MKVSILKQPLKGFKFLTETIRNNFPKFFSTVNDALNKLKKLAWQVSDVQHRTLLTRVTADLAEAAKTLEVVEGFLEKPP